MKRDWIVIMGNPKCVLSGLVNSTDGSGGFEFFGPYTEAEAKRVQGGDHKSTIAVQLLRGRVPK